MILKIKKWLSKLRVFKRIREIEYKIGEFRKENFRLKGQLIDKRKTIKSLTNKLAEVEEKKAKASLHIAELTKRRDEFLNRLSATPDASINSFSDYKFWLSEPFIVNSYGRYESKKDDIDGDSAIRGLGNIFKDIKKEK